VAAPFKPEVHHLNEEETVLSFEVAGKIIAACGNDCAACPRYIAHPYEKTSEELQHTAELWMKIGYRDHIVTNEEISCTGCKLENWCRYHVVKCCQERGISTCGDCSDYPCENMKECFEVTRSFEPSCRKMCSDEEYELLKTAFFEKEKNIEHKEDEKMLETERLILRRWNENDAGDLYKYASDPDVGPIAGWPAHQSIEESRDVIKNVFNGKEAYAVCLKEDGKAIGAIELKLNGHTDMTDRDDECEMGYWLGKPFWGQGIMPEAVKEMLRHAFEDLGMQKVWIGYYEGNAKSKRVQEKCGFKYQWRSENVDVPLMHEKRTGHVSLMTKEDWETSHRTMKRELGIARCGLACCLCSENVTCKGCKRDGFMELSWCKDAEWCEVRRCGIEKNLSGCYECNPAECRKGLYAEKIKPRAFAEYARRYGLEELLDCLERNERAGVVYHREGITGDYDDFDDLEELIDFIKTGKKMCIDLKPIAREDIETVWKMQVEAFSDLLEKYQDYDMSPAAEDMDKVLARFEQPWTTYFFIMANNEKVGVIRVVDKKDGSRKRISPIWIMPEYRNKGYAQQAMLAAEKKYGSIHWCLDTILQEKGNLHLYEKLGYHQTGRIDRVNDRMDIVCYEKD
jgi:RimJ/RimL family protein N-acetyltransferase